MTKDSIQRWWPQIAFAVLVVFAMGGSYVQLDALAEDVKDNTEKIEKAEDLKIEVVRQGVEQKHIKDDVKEIKEDVKEILDAVRETR